MRKLFWTLFTVSFLVGCATEYGAKSFWAGGFEETQLAPDVYRVTFSANDSTTMVRTSDFALLRAAELALENGYPYFEILDAKQWVNTDVYSTPVTTTTTGSVAGSGNTVAGSSVTTTTGGQTFSSDEPHASNTVRFLKTKDDASSMAYDARFLFDSLREKYQIIGQQ